MTKGKWVKNGLRPETASSSARRRLLSQSVYEFFQTHVRLAQGPCECSDLQLAMPGNDAAERPLPHDDMAATLACFLKP